MADSRIDRSGARNYVSHLHELLFSLNVTLAYVGVIISTQGVGVRAPFNCPFYVFNYVELGLMGEFHLRFHSEGQVVAGHIAFLATWVPFSLLLFLLMRIFARLSPTKQVLRTVAGMAALALWPAVWLRELGQAYASSWRLAGTLEVEASVICGLLYLRDVWPLPRWASVLLLTGHAAFWCWYYYSWVFYPPAVINPLIGFASSLAWAWHVSDRRASGHDTHFVSWGLHGV